ncbi:hypothetical protein [Herbidospora daliensis]|uniref:hypothetical protein n=1 Tax=Herbidospora daliensis TaxID=295585 RepID=UPI000784B5AA|nr:hypothetical protein [Herbidospora daliensis]
MRKYTLWLVVLGSALLALPASPAQAQTSGCGAEIDTRKTGSSVLWRLCLEDGDWPHGSLTSHCRTSLPFWTLTPCSVRGRFEIRKDDALVASGPFHTTSDLNGQATLDQIFTFRCDGPGVYTFAVTEATYTFPTLAAVALPGTRVARTAC